MKKMIFAIALLIMGGFSLSTASTANALPAIAAVSGAAEAGTELQLVGGGYYHHRKRHGFKKFHSRWHYGKHHGKGYGFYPKGYYKGFCYDYPYHGWCKKYFFKKY